MTASTLQDALAFHQQGKLAEAESLYLTILQSQPGHFDALHLLGIIAAQTQNHQRAVELITRAISINPNVAAPYLNIGLAYRELGQYEAALASFDHAIALDAGNAGAYNNRGNVLKDLHQLDAAVVSYQRAVALEPANADAWNNCGNAQQDLGHPAAALASYDQALAAWPDFVEAWTNRGNALKELKQLEDAVASYNQAIALQPDYAMAYCNRGVAQQDLKQFDAALASYDRAIALQPDYAKAYNNRGITLQELKQHAAAVASFDQAIALQSNFAVAYSNRGIALQDMKDLPAAVSSFDQAIALQADFADAYNNRGIALKELKQLEAAVASYDQAIALRPAFTEALSNRGVVLQELGLLASAVASYDQAIAQQPNYARAYSNRGMALQNMKQLPAAMASYDKALELQPDYADAYLNKSLALLLTGQFEQGWAMYEWRWKVASFASGKRNVAQPLWLGESPIAGKTILLHSEQGLGDTIQFCRYATMVATLGARVLLQVPKSLAGLLKDVDGVAGIVEQGQPLPDFDLLCPLLSLPLAFRTTIDSIPADNPYLHSDADKVHAWSGILGTKTRPRIGLVWSGSSEYKNDRNRSITLAQLLTHLVHVLPDRFDYVSLQKEMSEADRLTLAAQDRVRFFGDQLVDFTDTAALCDLMDLVITVDTSVAHLAAALGKTTWIMLPFVPDWRWLLDRTDSLWYPSVQLYRQRVDGDWNNLIAEVGSDLEKVILASS